MVYLTQKEGSYTAHSLSQKKIRYTLKEKGIKSSSHRVRYVKKKERGNHNYSNIKRKNRCYFEKRILSFAVSKCLPHIGDILIKSDNEILRKFHRNCIDSRSKP
jgi:hypothetical protein